MQTISARFTDPEHKTGVLTIDDTDWHGPLPPNAGDLRAVYDAWVAQGNEPEAYVEPVVVEIMPDLSDRQFFQGLAEEGVITWDEAEAAVGPGTIPQQLANILAAQISDETELKRARVKVTGAVTYKFDDPLVPMVQAAMQWSDTRLRTFWQMCASLT